MLEPLRGLKLNELLELQRQVRRDLRYARFLGNRDDGVPLAQVLILPSFGNYRAWDVIHDAGESKVFRTTWRFDLDVESFKQLASGSPRPTDPWPTVEVQEGNAQHDELDEHIHRLAKIAVPLITTEKYAWADGEEYELALSHFTAACIRLSWHCELPPQWKPLKKPFEVFVQYLEKVIPT